MQSKALRLIALGTLVGISVAVSMPARGTAHAALARPKAAGRCVAAKSDGSGGPYPAKISANCTALKKVTVNVETDPVIGGAFTPSNITIKKGTTVTWIWKSGSHNLAPFHAAIENPGFKFSKRFTKAGKYKYLCQVHPGQNGLVIVK